MTNHVVWVRLCQAVGQIPCGWLLINGLPGRLRPSKKWLPKRHCRARILRPCQQRHLPEILGGFFLVAREGVPLVEGFFWFFAHGDIGWSNYTARWFDYYNIIILLIHIYIYIIQHLILQHKSNLWKTISYTILMWCGSQVSSQRCGGPSHRPRRSDPCESGLAYPVGCKNAGSHWGNTENDGKIWNYILDVRNYLTTWVF